MLNIYDRASVFAHLLGRSFLWCEDSLFIWFSYCKCVGSVQLISVITSHWSDDHHIEQDMLQITTLSPCMCSCMYVCVCVLGAVFDGYSNTGCVICSIWVGLPVGFWFIMAGQSGGKHPALCGRWLQCCHLHWQASIKMIHHHLLQVTWPCP